MPLDSTNTIYRGKTKTVIPTGISQCLVITKDVISKGDGAEMAYCPDSDITRTQTCAYLMQILNEVGIETSFDGRLQFHTMLQDMCDMIPLEVVVRRLVTGSATKRYPELGEGHVFEELCVEFFYKPALVMPPLADEPTFMPESQARELFMHEVNGKMQFKEGVYTDSYIDTYDEGDGKWAVYSAKGTVTGEPLTKIGAFLTQDEVKHIENQSIKAFQVIEESFAEQSTEDGSIKMIDWKIEFGRRVSDDQIIIADSIDQDSMRLWPGGKKDAQLDKQNYREGEDVLKVANKYRIVRDICQKMAYDIGITEEMMAE